MKKIIFAMGLFSLFSNLTSCLTSKETEVVTYSGEKVKLSDYNGTWYTRDQKSKIRIKNGSVEISYFYENKWSNEFSGEGILGQDGEFRCGQGLLLYAYLKKEGHLLHAPIMVTDAPAREELYALEGYESEFPPLPVYIKNGADVKDRHIKEFQFSSSIERGEAFPLQQLEGISDEIKGVWIVLDKRMMIVSARNKEDEKVLDKSYEFTEEKELQLADLLLTEGVLKNNPYFDSSDMMAPNITFSLDVKFASGEDIEMDTNYNFLIDEEIARKIVQLLIRE